MSDAPFPPPAQQAVAGVLSVIIPALNAEELLPACLDSLKALELPEGYEEVEIIVADNGSTDRTAEVAREGGAKVVSCLTPGQGAARNAAFAEARGEFFLCTDSDCTVAPDWATRMLEPFADPRIAGVGGKIVAARQESLAEIHCARREILEQERSLEGLPGFFPFIITANAAFRRAALDHVGVFDEKAHPAEDADLSWRLQWSGWKLAYAPAAEVQHFHRATLASYWRQLFGYGRATAKLFGKHKHRLGRRAWLGILYAGSVRRALFRLPWTLLTKRNRYERWEPALDLMARTADHAGRLRGSIESGVFVI